MSTELRERLLDALEALEGSQPTSFEAAFEFLAVYLPGLPPAQDQDLAVRFRRAIEATEVSKDRLRRLHRRAEKVPGRLA